MKRDVARYVKEMVGQRELGSTKIVWKTKESIEMIRERLWTAQRRQKSCTDKQRSGLEFNVGVDVFITVERSTLIQKEGELGPSYIRPFKVIVCVGKVAYRIELPSELSQLRKCLADESVHIPTNSVLVDENTECRVERETKTLQNKKIGLVKAHLEYRKGVKKIEKGLRALCHLVKLVMILTVRSAFDHRGSIVVAFLTQGKIVKKMNQGVGRPVPATSGHASRSHKSLYVPPGRLKGRTWLEVSISREAQFRLVVLTGVTLKCLVTLDV
ncbi:LOW QUALITY PROTEIN: hypothetical protein OSB04_025046 [Centaurea solstitialis]|uniref:Tf2-1-like SH3-like domain-containing protein n=1 Tax=Centaurea solstitialis TaxID=347529 RepID=A0AA38SMD0_9ASTR|nr:LOW QUALITY PROTEIN: hypothetical protein OSB04_025046 [Centaurea solstitialis]